MTHQNFLAVSDSAFLAILIGDYSRSAERGAHPGALAHYQQRIQLFAAAMGGRHGS